MHFCGLFGACALHFIVWTVLFNVKEEKKVLLYIIMVFCATDLIADILYSLDFLVAVNDVQICVYNIDNCIICL